ncbi:hypothetical protein ACFX13_006207 [Malus domestica]
MPKIEEEPVSAERQKTTGEGRDCQESKTQTGEDKQCRRIQGCRSLIKDCIVMGLFGKTVLKTNCETFFPAMTRIVGTLGPK